MQAPGNTQTRSLILQLFAADYDKTHPGEIFHVSRHGVITTKLIGCGLYLILSDTAGKIVPFGTLVNFRAFELHNLHPPIPSGFFAYVTDETDMDHALSYIREEYKLCLSLSSGEETRPW